MVRTGQKMVKQMTAIPNQRKEKRSWAECEAKFAKTKVILKRMQQNRGGMDGTVSQKPFCG